ncbi:MAG: putative metal-binding motif-containing protein, partial [Myxococcota bacterium]
MPIRCWWLVGALVACDPTTSETDPTAGTVPDPVDPVDPTDPTDPVVDADNDGHDATVDCDDNDASVFPGATELCNAIDDDCDDAIDEGVTTDFYVDFDEDGYGDRTDTPVAACTAPTGRVADASDCDDGDDAISPDAIELCNDVDDDCNDMVDDGLMVDFYPDTDDDGFGDAATTPVSACAAPADHVANGMDCDDTTDAVFPGATEVCNGIDDDCVDGVDDGLVFEDWYPDTDGDGYGNAQAAPINACSGPVDHVANGADCDDTTDTISPAKVEVCNGIDDDCAGGVDDGIGTPRTNFAVGATATATNTFPGYQVQSIVDGVRTTELDPNQSWVNNNGERGTAEVEIDFGGDVSFGRIDVYSTELMETRGFTIEYWDGAAWTPLAVESGLTAVRTVVTFPEITTSRIRFVNIEGSNAQSGYARLNEIEVYANQAPATTISATTTFPGYSTAEVVDGSRGTALGEGWTNADGSGYPQTLEFDFAECRSFDVFVLTTT